MKLKAKKKYIIISVAVVSLLVGGISQKVYSAKNEIKVAFDNEVWDSNDVFEKQWFTNLLSEDLNEEDISFEVNLKGYMTDETDILDIPFTVEANVGETEIQVSKIEPVQDNDGIYSVILKRTNLVDENIVDINISFIEANSWDIPAMTKSFNIAIDTVKPKITFSGVEDNAVYSDNVIQKINLDELNKDTTKVTVEIYKPNAEKNKLRTETLTWKDITQGNLPKGFLYNIQDETLDIIYEEEEFFEVKVTAEDKAHNKESKSVNFSINKDKPKVILNGIEINELNSSYYWNKPIISLVIKDNSILSYSNSSYSVTYPDGTEANNLKLSKEGSYILFRESINNIACPNDGVYKIKAKAFDIGGQKSEHNMEVTVDTKNPTRSITGIENGAYYNTAKNVHINLDDENLKSTNIEIFKDSNLQIKKENEKSLVYNAETEGKYTIVAEAIDKANNEIGIGDNYEFTIDTKAPEINFSGVTDGALYKIGETPTAIINIEDINFANSEIKVTYINEKNVTKVETYNQSNLTLPIDKDGDYMIEIKAIDKANNLAEKKISFTRDTVAPVIEVESEGMKISRDDFTKDNLKYIKAEKGISFSINVDEINEAYSEIYVTKTNVFIDKDDEVKNEPVVSFEKEKQVTFNTEGLYELTINTRDKVGNTDTRTLYFVVDGTAPQVDVNKLYEFNNEEPLKITTSEAFIEGTEVNVSYVKTVTNEYGEDSSEEIFLDPYYISQKIDEYVIDEFRDDAKYQVSITAKDKAGNEKRVQTIEFYTDHTKPSVEINGVDEGEHYNRDKEVTIKTYDVNQNVNEIIVTKDGSRYTEAESFPNEGRNRNASFVYSEEGTYKIEVNCTDKAGNTESKYINFVIDKTAPVIEIVDFDNLNNSFNNYDRSVTVNVRERNFIENTVNVYYEKLLPNGNKTRYTKENFGMNQRGFITSETYNEFSDNAEYTMFIESVDKAGNKAITRKVVFTTDKVKPELSILGVELDKYYNEDKTAEFKSFDVNHKDNAVVVTRNGQPYNIGTPYVSNRDAILRYTFTEEGTYEVNFVSTDKAGNSNTTFTKFTIDKTAPRITPRMSDGTPLTNGQYINKIFVPEFALDNPEDTLESVTLNGGGNIAYSPLIASNEMQYNYNVVAVDKAQNRTNLNISFVVDTTMPSIKISGILSGFFNRNMTPIYEITDVNLDVNNTSALLNGQPFVSGTEIEAQENYNLKILANDLANNSNNQAISFTIDKDKPVISFKNPISGKYFTENFIPEFLINDLTDYTIIALTLDGEDYEIGDPITEEGKHVLYIEVKDKAENIESLSVEFILDKTEPKFIVDGIEDGKVYSEAVTATIRLENPMDKITGVSVNGEASTGEVSEEFGQQVIKLNFTEINDYSINLKAVDDAGNETDETINIRIIDSSIVATLINNKKNIFIGIIIATVAIAVALAGVVYSRKRNASKE